MRLSLALKLTLAVIGMVMLSVGTMAWLTSRNLERGFIAYLNELQSQHLEQVADILAEQYQLRGDFEWLRADPRSLSDLIAQRNGDIHPELDDPPPPRPDPPQQQRDDRPPEQLADGPPPHRIPYGPAPTDDRRPGFDRPPPSPRNDARPPPADPFGFGPRLSLHDAQDRPVFGPPHPGPGMTQNVEVDGRVVGVLTLVPLRQIPAASALGFVRGQTRNILALAAGLMLLSALLAIWLARRLLRPVAALRIVTKRIAQGKLDARAPILGGDELAELAEHVNAMAQALEANERQRRAVLADVSHELRTPLTVIRGEIESLQDGIRKADATALESLHTEVLRLNKLVDDLHQLALADAGDLHYARRRVDLTQLADEAVARFRERAGKAGLQLLAKLPTQVLPVHADADRLTQVLTNLLENSLRYTDAGGSVVLSLRADGKHAELSIEDSAPGVPDGVHVRLFERLYRVDPARSRQRGGSGLGLSICKSLIDAHRGSIVAMPSTLGGLKVLIRLPLSSIAGE